MFSSGRVSEFSDPDIQEVIVILYNKARQVLSITSERGSSAQTNAGEHEFMVQILNRNVTLLEEMKEMLMIVELTIAKGIDVPVHKDSFSSLQNGLQFGPQWINPGESAMIVLGPMKGNIPKRFLRSFNGTVSFSWKKYFVYCYVWFPPKNDVCFVPSDSIKDELLFHWKCTPLELTLYMASIYTCFIHVLNNSILMIDFHFLWIWT